MHRFKKKHLGVLKLYKNVLPCDESFCGSTEKQFTKKVSKGKTIDVKWKENLFSNMR